MKSFREWVEENNLNEIFGLFGKPKPKAQEPAPAVAPPKQKKAWCPFCLDWSAVEEDAYYPHGKWEWQCQKCRREWDSKTVADREKREPDDYADRGTTAGIFLRKDEVRPSNPGLKESLYLAGLISEESYYENEQQAQVPQQNQQAPQQNQQAQAANQQQGQPADINQVASQLQFQPTSKKKLMYQYSQSTENMPAMSYTVAQQQMPVVTTTADGKETQNTAEPNDIIMSGPSREQYVIKAAKFPKLYVGSAGGPVHPEQSPRNVAIYTGKQPVTFTAPWGESMVLKPGDYLVKEAEGKYYRIAKQEYEATYNQPGKVG